jgi:uncharacterized protein (TIGR03067 family)
MDGGEDGPGPREDEVERVWLSLLKERVEEREVAEEAADKRTLLEFKGGDFLQRHWDVGDCGVKGHAAWVTGTYHLDVRRHPKVLQKWWDGTKSTSRGIYRLDGDTLQVCLRLDGDSTNLPASFATEKDPNVVLLTFKRESASVP